VKLIIKLTVLSAAVSLVACSVLDSEKVDYKSVKRAPDLSIPPDLAQLSKDTRYTMVDGGVSATSLNASPGAKQEVASIAGTTVGDVRIERSGNQRWLVVKRSANQLWDPIRAFWLEGGFLLSTDERNLGIMETEWAENRAKLPQDFIRSIAGKFLDSLYSTPERDKYRTRLETNANGETEIYISHRGMMELYITEHNDQTMWQPRPEDPELEAEYLRRLMLKLGVSAEQATALLATPSAPMIAAVATTEGASVLKISENFDRAWRRVGLALDRTGFTVEDRDRNRGLYFVRYVGADTSQPTGGFFSRLFSSAPTAGETNKYQISVTATGDFCTVSVLNDKGTPENSATAQRIVKVLADDIK